MSQSGFLTSYERDINSSTEAIATARDDAQLAAAYSKRGSTYSEKARYSRAFKLISSEEYGRLFGLAIQDHDQAIALAPAKAEAYFNRGQAYYDRANLETVVDGVLVVTDAAWKAWFDPAVADFKKAVELDGRYERAWDMLGLTHETTGELDLATAPILIARLDDLGGDRPLHLVADATALTFCDCSGLGALVRAYHRAVATGGWLRLCGVAGIPEKVIRLTRVSSVLSCYADVAEALAAPSPDPPTLAPKAM